MCVCVCVCVCVCARARARACVRAYVRVQDLPAVVDVLHDALGSHRPRQLFPVPQQKTHAIPLLQTLVQRHAGKQHVIVHISVHDVSVPAEVMTSGQPKTSHSFPGVAQLSPGARDDEHEQKTQELKET